MRIMYADIKDALNGISSLPHAYKIHLSDPRFPGSILSHNINDIDIQYHDTWNLVHPNHIHKVCYAIIRSTNKYKHHIFVSRLNHASLEDRFHKKNQLSSH